MKGRREGERGAVCVCKDYREIEQLVLYVSGRGGIEEGSIQKGTITSKGGACAIR